MIKKKYRYKTEIINIKNPDGTITENVITVYDNYFKDSLRMDNIADVNELINNLNVANKVLGDEFEATYE